MGVDEDVAVQHLGEPSAVVVGPLPVRGLLRLGVWHRPQLNPVVTRVGAGPGGFLLAPVLEGVGLGLAGLVDDQELAAVRILDVDVVALVRDVPAVGHADREPGRVVVPGEPGGQHVNAPSAADEFDRAEPEAEPVAVGRAPG